MVFPGIALRQRHTPGVGPERKDCICAVRAGHCIVVLPYVAVKHVNYDLRSVRISV